MFDHLEGEEEEEERVEENDDADLNDDEDDDILGRLPGSLVVERRKI